MMLIGSPRSSVGGASGRVALSVESRRAVSAVTNASRMAFASVTVGAYGGVVNVAMAASRAAVAPGDIDARIVRRSAVPSEVVGGCSSWEPAKVW